MQFVLRDKKSQMISIHDLEKMLRQKIKAAKETLTHLKQTLTALNPRNILKRGYSITRNQKTGQLIRHAKEVSPNDMMITQLSDGEILSRVE
ncbi:MAG: hypothetical protein ACD_70C00161G0001 [uncultured bacterium]|nr:MAG: hypothetical protein ACD_70C00161G0001 [uncultured bacterium]